MAWPPELLLHQPGQPLVIDATQMGVSVEQIRQLDWPAAFAAMANLEAGGIANPDEDRQVGHYWLRAPERAPTVAQASAIGGAVDAVRTFAEHVRSGAVASPDGDPFTDVLHIGIGGSALGPAFLVDALESGGLPVHFLDNTDPEGIQRILDRVGDRLRHSLVIVVSKSGSTPEPMNALALVRQACIQRGLATGQRCIAITVQGSKLDNRAREEKWLATFPIWDWVGGRNSALSAAGLLPAALAGADVSALLTGAAAMDAWTRVADPTRNPAALLAGCWYVIGNGAGDRAGVVIPYADRLVLLSRYLQQLVMESLGQRLDLDGNVVHQGLTIYGNKGSTDQHAYVQQLRDGRNDFFVTFVQVLDRGVTGDLDVGGGITAGDYLQGFLLGTRRAMADADRPSITLTVPTVDEAVVGGLVALIERAVGLYGALIGINPYHQPGVEAGKTAARDMLELSVALRTAVAEGGGTAEAFASALKADVLECWYVLEHLYATGRLARDGHGPETVWRAS